MEAKMDTCRLFDQQQNLTGNLCCNSQTHPDVGWFWFGLCEKTAVFGWFFYLTDFSIT